jgi:hypothetical protein
VSPRWRRFVSPLFDWLERRAVEASNESAFSLIAAAPVDDVSVHAPGHDEVNVRISHPVEQLLTVLIDEVNVREDDRDSREGHFLQDRAPVLFHDRDPVSAEHSMELQPVVVSVPIGDHTQHRLFSSSGGDLRRRSRRRSRPPIH